MIVKTGFLGGGTIVLCTGSDLNKRTVILDSGKVSYSGSPLVPTNVVFDRVMGTLFWKQCCCVPGCGSTSKCIYLCVCFI